VIRERKRSKTKKKIEMKKIIFTLILFISMSMNVMAYDVPVINKFANTDKIELVHTIKKDTINPVNKYDFTVNYRRLGVCLGMTLDQMDEFKLVFDQFKNDMMFAYTDCEGLTRDSVVRNSVLKNIKNTKFILDDKQYKKYLVLMNTTLNNRGFNIASK
jgi:hypothetical protein